MKRALPLAAVFLFLALLPARSETIPAYVELADAPIITVDWSKGNTQIVTLHGDRALTFTNGQKGGKYLLIVRQDATGSRVPKWPASVHWAGAGPPPILTTTANRKDYVSFFYDGVTYDLVALSQGL